MNAQTDVLYQCAIVARKDFYRLSTFDYARECSLLVTNVTDPHVTMPTWIFARAHGACALVVLLSICINPLIGAADGDERSFVIKDDVFLKDGEPLQIISGR